MISQEYFQPIGVLNKYKILSISVKAVEIGVILLDSEVAPEFTWI